MFEDKNNPAQPQKAPVEDIFAETETAPANSAGGPSSAPAQAPAPPRPSEGAQQPGPPTALAGGKLQISAQEPISSVPSDQASGAAFPLKKMLVIIGSSLGIIVIAVIGFFIMKDWAATNAPAPALGQPESPAQETQDAVEAPPSAEAQAPNPDENSGQKKDTSGSIGDFINNFQEESSKGALNPLNLDPTRTDTDQDGLSDAQEFDLGTNPRLVDSDNDGLSDWEEHAIFGTDPLNKDTDSDGYLDGEEVQNGYDPNGPGKLLNFETAK